MFKPIRPATVLTVGIGVDAKQLMNAAYPATGCATAPAWTVPIEQGYRVRVQVDDQLHRTDQQQAYLGRRQVVSLAKPKNATNCNSGDRGR